MGVGQGKRLSVDLFNVGSLSNAIWTVLSDNVLYADDGGDVVVGDSMEELNHNIKTTASVRAAWFNLAGLTLNGAKSELMGFGVSPEPLIIEGATIKPSKFVKFLGLTIDENLSFNIHVDNIAARMRSAAGRIRAEGRHVNTNDRRTLFNGWVRSILSCNGLAYLPHLNASQLQTVSAAYNSGIRAIFNLPKKGYAPISELRSMLNIPSVEQIKDYILQKEAWKRRSNFIVPTEGPITRGRAKLNVPLPNKKGWEGKRLTTILCDYWNSLPLDTKTEDNQTRATRAIKKTCFNF